VTGATADSERTAALIRDKKGDIKSIFITLDSHHRNHVAHGISWVDKDGNHPAPFTLISGKDAANEVWKAADPKRTDIFKKYAADLEKGGKFKVCIWPEHCLIGSVGHSVQDDINGAVQDWAGETGRNVEYVWKGQNLDTEMYSAMAAEVVVHSDPRTKFNEVLMAHLNECDILIICGQALSHCVNFTARDIASRWQGEKDRLILLTDCASPVTGFEQSAEDFKSYCQTSGIRVMDSLTLSQNWSQICGLGLETPKNQPASDFVHIDVSDAPVVSNDNNQI